MLVIAHRGASAAFSGEHAGGVRAARSPRAPTGSSSTCAARPTAPSRCQPRRRPSPTAGWWWRPRCADLPEDIADAGAGPRRLRAARRASTSRSRTGPTTGTSTRSEQLAAERGRPARRARRARRRAQPDLVLPPARRSIGSTSWPRVWRPRGCSGSIDGPRRARSSRPPTAATSPSTRTTRSSTRRSSPRAHAAGLAVNTWTCDDPDRIRVAGRRSGSTPSSPTSPTWPWRHWAADPRISGRPRTACVRNRPQVSPGYGMTRSRTSGSWLISRCSMSPRWSPSTW